MSEENPTIIRSYEELIQVLGEQKFLDKINLNYDVASRTSELILIGCDGFEYRIPFVSNIKRKADKENENVENKRCKLSNDE